MVERILHYESEGTEAFKQKFSQLFLKSHVSYVLQVIYNFRKNKPVDDMQRSGRPLVLKKGKVLHILMAKYYPQARYSVRKLTARRMPHIQHQNTKAAFVPDNISV